MSEDPERWRNEMSLQMSSLIGVLWGKSPGYAGGTTNLLLQHLFDTMAVAKLIWDRFLPASVRAYVDAAAAENDGRCFYTWLCGLHDIGKATPAFQSKDPGLAARVRTTGLPWPDPPLSPQESAGWRHEKASAAIVREHLAGAWKDPAAGKDQCDWVWPLLAGHHGAVPPVGDVDLPARKKRWRARLHGDGLWAEVHSTLLRVVTAAAGYPSLTSVMPASRPRRTDQLALAGFIVMADWIASDERRFTGIDTLGAVGQAVAAQRADRAWDVLGMRKGWGALPPTADDLVERRFGQSARPLQEAAIAAAENFPVAGLLVVEAPMGEGKTEAALCATEVLASRFGADGVYVAMPTQATADPMFTRTRRWLRSLDPQAPIALVHGKRMFNDEWRHLVARSPAPERRFDGPASPGGFDEYGLIDDPPPAYGGVAEDCSADSADAAPSEWLLGRHRALLSPNGVGTIDQVLYAGTRTRYVMLRTAGLVGKVVVFDEVHAADAYMAQFLGEVLTWLGAGNIPVILLSATLSPDQRRHLVSSYLRGQVGDAHLEVELDDLLPGYPSLLRAHSEDGTVTTEVTTAAPWREDLRVSVSVAEEGADPDETVEDELRARLGGGGCVLVLRNTVARAQATYERLREWLGQDVVLLHSRFSAADRAERTEAVLAQLGLDPSRRPHRLVVVATQVAEQSFDIDVDLLVSDVAPIDLLLQRIGRLHRHARAAGARPPAMRDAAVIVTGMRTSDELPWFPLGCEAVYGRYPLLRSAALVWAAATGAGGWTVPSVVPGLVAKGYGDEAYLPPSWAADAADARDEWERVQQRRRDKARPYLLTAQGHLTAPTLEGLHERSDLSSQDIERRVRVRDGESGEEVVLLRRDAGGYHALDGRNLGPNADAGPDHLASVLGGTVRLPHRKGLAEALRAGGAFPAWSGHPWLGRANVVILDGDVADIGGWVIRYDAQIGLTVGSGS